LAGLFFVFVCFVFYYKGERFLEKDKTSYMSVRHETNFVTRQGNHCVPGQRDNREPNFKSGLQMVKERKLEWNESALKGRSAWDSPSAPW
jgi:hypothetical protein